MAYEIPVTRARAELADLINRVVYGGERVVVTRHGKPLVALVSADDLRLLDDAEELRKAAEGPDEVAAEAPVIRAVSTVHEVGSAQGEQHRYGITAHHQGP